MENKLILTINNLKKINVKVETNNDFDFIKFKLINKEYKINSIDFGKMDLINDLIQLVTSKN